MADARISLVVPMYNAARHLEACLESVARQTLGAFECLCVDDGSTDGSAAIAQSFAGRDARFRVLRQANAGCSAARNAGLRLAAAPHLAFLDADDLLHPQAFEVALALLARHAADVASFAHRDVPDAFELRAPERVEPGAVAARVTDEPFRAFFKVARDKVKSDPVEIWLHVYRRAALADLAFTEGVHFAEDAVFMVKVMHAIRRRVATPAVLLYHRDNPASAINQGITERYMRSHAQAARELRGYFAGRRLAPAEASVLARYLSYMLYKACVSQPARKLRPPEGRALLALARQLAAELAAEGLLDAGCLGLRKRLAARCFLGGWDALARRLA
jgi:CDP-glycerol glycerophosphotransferase